MKEQRGDKIKYCKKCGKRTKHLLCGFGIPGGLTGNARYRCLICKTERI